MEVTRVEQRSYIKIAVLRGKNAMEYHNELVEALGNNAVPYRTAARRCADFENDIVAAVAEWYRYRIVACLVTSSSPVPLKTRHVGQRCTLNLSRAETSSC
ncbi:hypothetical protein TNCV_1715751 [Trichonephila clavipes]|nr:hypothetical protein TNCV_1715751 [Trichonephila clavipes]